MGLSYFAPWITPDLYYQFLKPKSIKMTTPIQTLHQLGQSLWYDNIQRSMLDNGEIEALIRRGEIRGMTSNPSIFNQSISQSTGHDSYASALTTLAWAGCTAQQILDQLVIEDIRAAADLFIPLYQETHGDDGYVSVEVNPGLANDTQGTLEEARRLWKWIDRPNLMIKIPATREGIPAVQEAIASGINVNITLIFSITRYVDVMNAYLAGLEERLANGHPVDHIASVASFFVSRIDIKVDKYLADILRQEGIQGVLAGRLQGTAAIASARLAYSQFRSVFESERFRRLASKGARVQRPLWASTSTKNPAYPDTMYVDELIGPDTVNTVPPPTLDAFRDHGRAQSSLEDHLDEAKKVFSDLATLNISIDEITKQLEVEGVAAFTDAFNALLNTIEIRRQEAVARLGILAIPVAKRVDSLEQINFVSRMWASDASLWTDDPKSQDEVRHRLGWLELPVNSRSLVEDLKSFTVEVHSQGYTHALLLGMGGSSLAPEVMRLICGVETGGLDLAILDSTDPAQVRSSARRAPVKHTLYIVSSKSGGTAEVNAFLDYFWKRARRAVGARAGDHFVAITDPGTSLERVAKERGFRRIFLADPTVGGRSSALSAFGLLSAALVGLDLNRLLSRGEWMQRQSRPEIPAQRNPGLVLGAILGEATLSGRDKLTFIADSGLEPFGSWLEQLIAESSGKQGKGIVPVDGEPLSHPGLYSKDRIFVYFRWSGKYDRQIARLEMAGHTVLVYAFLDDYDLGSEFYRWEFATAVACHVLGVNAFDQPDVQDSKDRTKLKVADYKNSGQLDEGQPIWEGEGIRVYGEGFPLLKGLSGARSIVNVLEGVLSLGKKGDYVALNAYLPRTRRNAVLLRHLRVAIRKRTLLATTVGFGPRFQHSTGQLHKGGPNNGLFLLITVENPIDLPVPMEGLSFGVLERAQALGDLEALINRGRRTLRLHLDQPDKLRRIIEALQV